MAETTHRILRLLSLLEARSVWTGPDLAERLDVTARTVRRDIDRLRDLGYPVHAAHGPGGGYRLGRGRRLPPLVLDDDEAVAAAIALRIAAASDEAVGESALRALTKLDQVLPVRLAAEVRALDLATATLPQPGTAMENGTLLTAARAIRDGVRLRFDYEARDAQRSVRDCEPYRLVTTGRRWYLFAWDLGRSDWRTFRVDRMAAARASTLTFAARPTPDPVAQVRQAMSRGGYGVVATAHYTASAEALRQRVPATIGEVTALGDRQAQLIAGADDAHHLAWHLAWIARDLDADLTIIDPPEVREALAAMGQQFTHFARS